MAEEIIDDEIKEHLDDAVAELNAARIDARVVAIKLELVAAHVDWLYRRLQPKEK